MPNLKFTDQTIRTLGEGLYFDDTTPAFGIRIGKTRRTWLVTRGRREARTKVKLGLYPQLSLADARRKAYALLGTSHRPAAIPFPEARDAYLEAQAKVLRPRSYYQLQRTLNRHFNWSKSIDKVTHSDVSVVIDGISAPSEAWHAFKDIRAFFNWCVPKHIPSSPCTGLSAPSKYVPRKRLLSDDEIRKIWKAAATLGAYGLQVRRIIATGQRPNQIFSLQREWVKENVIEFPDTIMKNKLPHSVPFGTFTAELFKEFPSVTNQGKFKKQLDNLSGVTGYTLQDIRKFYSSTHARLKTPIDITETLLSHITGSRSPIQRVYDLYDRLDEMREAVDRYESNLIRLLAD